MPDFTFLLINFEMSEKLSDILWKTKNNLRDVLEMVKDQAITGLNSNFFRQEWRVRVDDACSWDDHGRKNVYVTGSSFHTHP